MPIIKSAKKALRQSRKRKELNSLRKKELKNVLKDIKDFVSQKKKNEAKNLLPRAYKLLDKAAKTGLIKKNTASRKKSRLAKLISKDNKK